MFGTGSNALSAAPGRLRRARTGPNTNTGQGIVVAEVGRDRGTVYADEPGSNRSGF
jgi:hypothetical protein